MSLYVSIPNPLKPPVSPFSGWEAHLGFSKNDWNSGSPANLQIQSYILAHALSQLPLRSSTQQLLDFWWQRRVIFLEKKIQRFSFLIQNVPTRPRRVRLCEILRWVGTKLMKCCLHELVFQRYIMVLQPEVQFKLQRFESVYCSWQVVLCSCRTIIIGLNVSWKCFQAFSFHALV